jgi:hypothetical protein
MAGSSKVTGGLVMVQAKRLFGQLSEHVKGGPYLGRNDQCWEWHREIAW